MVIESGLSRPLCRALVEMPNGLTTRETYFNIYAGESSLVAPIPSLTMTSVKLALP